MQTLAEMLEEKEPVKITTAELARRTNITEAAIYRHFPSKRKIYENKSDADAQKGATITRTIGDKSYTYTPNWFKNSTVVEE